MFGAERGLTMRTIALVALLVAGCAVYCFAQFETVKTGQQAAPAPGEGLGPQLDGDDTPDEDPRG